MSSAGEWVNEVRLVGRVSVPPEERELPSGDQVVQVRVVVPRQQPAAGTARVDTIDVACWTARSRRTARTLAPDDRVEVSGALRRRFFRTGNGAVSRYEVEAATVRRVRAPAASTA